MKNHGLYTIQSFASLVPKCRSMQEKSQKSGRSGDVIGCGLRHGCVSPPTRTYSWLREDSWQCSLRGQVGGVWAIAHISGCLYNIIRATQAYNYYYWFPCIPLSDTCLLFVTIWKRHSNCHGMWSWSVLIKGAALRQWRMILWLF